MSQDQDPIDATRSFEPVDPYNIPPERAGAPMPGYEGYQQGHDQQGFEQQGFEQQPHGTPQPRPQGFTQRLTRLGPLKLALLGTAGVIVLGGAAMGTAAAFQSGSSSSTTAATAPATDQSQTPGQAPGGGATTGGTGRHKAGKAVRLKVTHAEAGTIWGLDAKGRQVTVTYGDATKFGTKRAPLNPANITAGVNLLVVGQRSGDTITATAIDGVLPKQAPGGSDTATPPPPAASPTDPASPVGGNA